MTTATVPPPPAPGTPGRSRLVLLGAFLLVLHTAARRLRDSGAIPVEEFGPAKVVYAALPALLGLGLAAAAAGLLARRRGDLPLLAGAALLVASPWLPALLAPGILVVTAGTAALAARRREGDGAAAADAAVAISRVGPAGLLRAFLVAAAAATVSAAVLGLLETSLRTARFSPRLFPPEALGPVRLAALAWAGVRGVLLGAIAAAAVLGLAALLAGVRRALPRDPAVVPFAGTLLAGLGAGTVAWLLVDGAFGDEIRALGLSPAVAGLAVLLAGAVHANAWSRLARGGFRGPDGLPLASAGGFAATLAAFTMLPPGLPVRSRGRHAAALAAATAAVLALLAVALFPDVEDYREKGFSLYATTAVLALSLALIGLRAVARPRPAADRAILALGLALPAAAILAGAGAASRSEVRLVFHEYSRFGPVAHDDLPEALFRPFPRIGEEDPGIVFVHHAPGEETLPPRPAALADRPARPPILLLVWDAVRPDHLQAFGGRRDTTPVLDRLAAESVLFTNARSNGTATTVSTRSFLSGRYATRYMLSKKHPVFFARELAEAGYRRFVVTVMGTDYNGVSADSFVRGWDPAAAGAEFEFIDIPSDDDEGSDPPKVTKVLEVLAKGAAAGPAALDGTFVYLHLIGGHLPWESTGFGTSPSDRYDGEIAKLDRLTGRLLEGLAAAGVLDRFVVVVLADHGTGLGEHGRIGGFFAYEEQVRVPLLFRIPGLAPRRVADAVSLIDVAPTLVGLVAPGRENPYHGRSLMPLLAGEADRLPPRPVVSLCAFNDAWALVDGEGRFKLWHHRSKGYEALFDLRADPAETRDVSAAHRDVAARMRSLLGAFLWQGRDSYAAPWHYREWPGLGR